jgi:hypothetical protein
MECLDAALGENSSDADLIILNASIGHDLAALTRAVRERLPEARIVAASCAGVVGREGVSESMKDVALMAVRGEEFRVAHVDGILGHNAREKGLALAEALREQSPDISMVYLLASGIDIANDELIAAFEQVFGNEVTIFGATTSDNMRGVASFQALDEQVFEHAAIAVGFCDPGLEVETQATHGFVASGEPMTITAVRGNRILELDGKPAWTRYLDCLGLEDGAQLADTIPIGAVAEALPPDDADAYGNSHILRVITHVDGDGALVYPTLPRKGTSLWLTERDEELIFSDMTRLVEAMQQRAGSRLPVAVFQADCLARGRRLFNRIIKEELVERMQHPFSDASGPPAWLGMYGFGEYARLLGVNSYHNYTTAIAALYRTDDAA